MKRTNKYQLGYFEQGDVILPSIESQRFTTLDSQLYALFNVIGNGVISGFDILANDGLSIFVAAGSAIVNYVSVSTNTNTKLSNLEPNTDNYIYAALTTSSYWDQSVAFSSYTFLQSSIPELLYLGKVTTDGTSVTDINIDDRVELSFVGIIKSLIEQHRHIGGADNPPPIDLAHEVSGIISQSNLPDIDASMITTGIFDVNRIPKIDHISKLTNQGTLTHAQLDSFVENLSQNNMNLMGETSTINLLQLILALKHIYPDIDQYLVNSIAVIPGISPDSYIDTNNTSAIVDLRTYSEGGQHTITGTASTGKKSYTKTWDSNEEYNSGTKYNVSVSGDSVSLSTKNNVLVIDDFGSEEDITKWTVTTTDLSSVQASLSEDTVNYKVPPSSGKLVIGSQNVEMALSFKKDFSAQDWSSYDYLVFYINTTNVEHGDVYFYLNDATYGSQNSFIKILDRNTPTIDIDTLQNGWQQVTIDIRSYSRETINAIGFYISTQEGWDTSKSFTFNIDYVYLETGNVFKDNGYIRLIYGSEFMTEFWRMRWDSVVPTDSESAGVSFKVRTRVANSESELNNAVWSSYMTVSGSTISLPSSNYYKYIEVECYFGASTSLKRSVFLYNLYLDYYVTDVDNEIEYNSKDDWDSGTNFNIDTQTVPGSMIIANSNEVNNYFYGTDGNAYQLDSDMQELYKINGSMLPRSTHQVLNNIQPSLGLITGIDRGNMGSVWMADVDNDRVIELNKDGSIITGFYGSFISVPVDNYGTEEFGPGSNENIVKSNTSSSTITSVYTDKLALLHSIYNSNDGVLYAIFNKNIENIYAEDTSLNKNKMYMKIGTQKFYLNEADFEVVSCDSSTYTNWGAIANSASTSTVSEVKFLNQFKLDSHVLKVSLDAANKVALNSMVDLKMPSVVIVYPYSQQLTSSSFVLKLATYNFTLGTQSGQDFIRVTVDDTFVTDSFSTNITLSGLSNGKHVVKVELMQGSGSAYDNIEAVCEGEFLVYTSLAVPYITIENPRINQIYSSSPVSVTFKANNFPILSTGQHVRYVIDSEAPVDYYSEDPITIEDLDAGKHTLTIYFVDKNGTSMNYDYGFCSVDFIVGCNSGANVKLFTEKSFVKDSSKRYTTSVNSVYVDVANVRISNIYSPIDVQVIPMETNSLNASGEPTVLVAKLRSQSWGVGLSSGDKIIELNNRVINKVATTAAATSTTTTTTVAGTETTTTTTVALNPIYAGIPTEELIYGTKYLDGHSVVQLDLSGNTIFSNNAAIFAKNKVEAKNILGSAKKTGDTELVIGDAYNKRAIITNSDISTQKSWIEWQYDSNRYISDFNLVSQDDVVISVENDAIRNANTVVKQGATVIWENNTDHPISIYSGTTNYDLFYQDPNLDIYGSDFYSDTLNPGERYSYKFVSSNEYDWFVYPDILTGKVISSKNRISSNDQFIILENDEFSSPFTSRVIKVDSWGNILSQFGSGYLVQPRDARPMSNGNILIST